MSMFRIKEMKKVFVFGMAICAMLVSCNKDDIKLKITQENLAGVWRPDRVVWEDDGSVYEEAADEEGFSYERYVFYPDGLGYYRSHGGTNAIQYSLQNATLTISDEKEGDIVVGNIIKLTRSTFVLEVSDGSSKGTAYFKKIHGDSITVDEIVGKWVWNTSVSVFGKEASTSSTIEFFSDGSFCHVLDKNTTEEGRIQINSHKITFIFNIDDATPVEYDIAFYDNDNIEFFSLVKNTWPVKNQLKRLSEGPDGS